MFGCCWATIIWLVTLSSASRQWSANREHTGKLLLLLLEHLRVEVLKRMCIWRSGAWRHAPH